jgi:cytochrome P450
MEERNPTAAPAAATDGCPAHGAAAVAKDFRPFDLSEPFEFYERARREAPVFFSEELGFWVVTRYEDIHAVFKDPKTFSSENTQAPYKPRPPEVQQVLDDAGFTTYSGLSARQPPEHTRLRGFIKKAFTPRRVAALEPEIRDIAVEMIGRFADRGHADMVGELAYDLPARVIFRLLGIPDEDVPKVKEWAQSRVYLNFGDQPLEQQVHHARNLVAYWRYCVGLIEDRFESPQDDLPTDLVRIYQEGDQSISIEEMAGLVFGQLTAGHETTTALVANAIQLMLTQRDRWEEICADPSLIPTAVEEALRVGTPVFAWKRRVKQPARVGDVDVPEGANVLLLLGSGNHDDAVFPDPDRIDLHRENARNHLSFGHGIHFCIGAPLARLEGQVVLEELSGRLPGLRLVDGQAFDYNANTTFRCPAGVLVEWDPAPAAPPAAHVLAFDDCAAGDVELVGGKAASLGSLIDAGLPVPPGFAVTTAAFEDHLRADGLGNRIDAELAGLDPTDVDALDAVAARVRRMLRDAPMPAAVASAIAAAYSDLCAASGGDPVPVAVRSSATAEDSADASFAGQQDTYLWVVGAEEAIDHVKRCWASLYSARAIAYRHDRGFDGVRVLMGVAVQQMVLARAAGVAMTLNPSNGDRSKIAIESSFGLGETVVGGTVTPDRFMVDKVMLEVLETKLSPKQVELVPAPAGRGVIERPIDPERQTRPSLAAEEATAVAALAKRAEQHFGCPQDVEWAIDGAVDPPAVVLLQSRPETVWSRKPAGDAGAARPSYMTGLGSIVNTLVNPLASRRTANVDSTD